VIDEARSKPEFVHPFGRTLGTIEMHFLGLDLVAGRDGRPQARGSLSWQQVVISLQALLFAQ